MKGNLTALLYGLVLFLALGLSDEDNPLKARAPGLVQASVALVKAADNESDARAAHAELKKRLTGEPVSGAGELSWDVKLIDLHLLMKQVTFVNSRLTRYARRESYLKSKREDLIGYAATLGVAGQATMLDTHEVKTEAEKQQWYGLAADMRDSAGAVGRSVRAGDFAQVTETVAALKKTCTDCHEVFRLDAP